MILALLTVCTTLFLHMVSCGSVPPTWATTSKIQSGTIKIVQSGIHQQGTDYYTLPYSPAYTISPYTALGIIGFETTDLQQEEIKLQIVVQNPTSIIQLKIKMERFIETEWKNLKISYFAIDQSFSMIQIDYFTLDDPTNVGVNIGERVSEGKFALMTGNIYLANQILVIPFLIGLDMHSVDGEHCLGWEMSLNDSDSINYRLTADRTTQIYSITSYVVIVDRSLASFDQQIFFFQVYLTGKSNQQRNEEILFYDAGNMHTGLNSFNFVLSSFQLHTNSLQLTTQGYYNLLNITILSYAERICSNPAMLYYQESTNLCYDTCPVGYVNSDGRSKKYCRLCGDLIYGCKVCSGDGQLCLEPFSNYVIVQPGNTSVICPIGYYQQALQDFTARCKPCHFSCESCFGPLQTNCNGCSKHRVQLADSSCVCSYGSQTNGYCLGPCDDPGCQKCVVDSAICEECSDSFNLTGSRCICNLRKYYDQQNLFCLDCHSSCETCWGPGAKQCLSCNFEDDNRQLSNSECLCTANYADSDGICVPRIRYSCEEEGYQLDSSLHQCIEICGDGIVIDFECDDGNNDNQDGCSSSCAIEEGYICQTNRLAPVSRSYCSYQEQIVFDLLETTKQIYSNQLNLVLSAKPSLETFSQFSNFIDNFQFYPSEFKITVKDAQYDKRTNQFHLQICYEKSIHEQQIEMVFKPPDTAQSYTIPDSHHLFSVTPQNNLVALSYPQQVYAIVKTNKTISMVVTIVGLVIAIALLPYRKMIGLEFIMMIQLIHQGSLLTNYTHPFLAPIHQIHYSNGFHAINIDGEALANFPFRTLGYNQSFSLNFSLVIILLIIIYTAALITFVQAHLREEDREKLNKLYQFFIDIGFGLVMFSLNGIISSLIVSIQSGAITDLKNIWEKVILTLIAIILVLHLVYFISMAHDSKDSHYFYHRHKAYAHFCPLLLIAKNTLITLLTFLKYHLGQLSPLLCVSFAALYILAVIIGRPYRKLIDYIRFGCIQGTLLYFLIYQMLQDQKTVDSIVTENHYLAYFFIVSLIAIGCGIIGSLALTLASFIYHLSITCTKRQQNRIILKKVDQTTVQVDKEFEQSIQALDNSEQNSKAKNKKKKKKILKSKRINNYPEINDESISQQIGNFQTFFEEQQSSKQPSSLKQPKKRQINQDTDSFKNARYYRRKRRGKKEKTENESMETLNNNDPNLDNIWAVQDQE